MNEEVEVICVMDQLKPLLLWLFYYDDKFVRIILSHRMRILPLIFEERHSAIITKIERRHHQLFDSYMELSHKSLIGSKHYKYDLLEISAFDGLLDR